MASADGVEKLEDAIVRSAEQVSGQIRAAKEAISTVIFGQDRVIEIQLHPDVRRLRVAHRQGVQPQRHSISRRIDV